MSRIWQGATAVNDYSLLFEQTSVKDMAWRAYVAPDVFDPEGTVTAGCRCLQRAIPHPLHTSRYFHRLNLWCRRVHAAHNFFMARTETLRRYPWHPQLAIFEHEHFFLKLFLANQALDLC